jgi:hypothetical protein
MRAELCVRVGRGDAQIDWTPERVEGGSELPVGVVARLKPRRYARRLTTRAHPFQPRRILNLADERPARGVGLELVGPGLSDARGDREVLRLAVRLERHPLHGDDARSSSASTVSDINSSTMV